MVGESDTVSRSFSAVGGSLFWFGGLIAIFTVIFVVATAFDSGNATQSGRNSPRNTTRPAGAETGEEPSMGLTPDIIGATAPQSGSQ